MTFIFLTRVPVCPHEPPTERRKQAQPVVKHRIPGSTNNPPQHQGWVDDGKMSENASPLIALEAAGIDPLKTSAKQNPAHLLNASDNR
jgi:hypothetical protein